MLQQKQSVHFSQSKRRIQIFFVFIFAAAMMTLTCWKINYVASYCFFYIFPDCGMVLMMPSAISNILLSNHEAQADEFLTKLNCLHPSLKFTFEKEKGKCVPFLDIYVKRIDVGLETSVYWKPTFTGQYLRWESFSFLKCKISLNIYIGASSSNDLHQA